MGIGVVAAQQDALKSAQTVMKGNGKALGGVLAPMNKGEKPYDQAAVTEALNTLDDTAKKLPTMFPASIKGMKAEGDYSPSPKIWEDKAGFTAAIATFAKAVTDAKASSQRSGYTESGLPGDRQIVRRLPRDLPGEEQLGFVIPGRASSRQAPRTALDSGSRRRAELCADRRRAPE